LAHPLPHAHHVSAGRIHKDTAFLFELSAGGNLRSECGNDHDIAFLQIGYVRILFLAA
jgi:hypothetical protein